MGSCCCGRYRQNYDVAEYTVEQPERVRVHSFAQPTSTTPVNADGGISLTQQYRSAPTEAADESLKDNSGSLEHDTLNGNERDIAINTNAVNLEILEGAQPSVTQSSVYAIKTGQEQLLIALNQGAAPLRTKRTVSVDAKSPGFIIDVPYLEGLGPDSSFMTSFNKVEVRSE